MKAHEKNTMLLALKENEDELKTLGFGDLRSWVFDSLGFNAPRSTLADQRKALGWPPLRQNSDYSLKEQVCRLEQTIEYLYSQLNIDLPDRLKGEE